MNQVFSSIYEHVIFLKTCKRVGKQPPTKYVIFILAIDTSYEASLEIIETFSVTTKIVKFSNITRNIFILDLNDFTCIRIIRRFVWERWQTCLCFCHGALYSVIISVLHIALNFDSYHWPERIHKETVFQNRWLKLKRNIKGA